ncbi:MAG: hypothetical protein HY650_12450 [Acidobacteria bacterium]|nr:hypothetical protein [Acidobacteriota bacterium]
MIAYVIEAGSVSSNGIKLENPFALATDGTRAKKRYESFGLLRIGRNDKYLGGGPHPVFYGRTPDQTQVAMLTIAEAFASQHAIEYPTEIAVTDQNQSLYQFIRGHHISAMSASRRLA